MRSSDFPLLPGVAESCHRLKIHSLSLSHYGVICITLILVGYIEVYSLNVPLNHGVETLMASTAIQQSKVSRCSVIYPVLMEDPEWTNKVIAMGIYHSCSPSCAIGIASVFLRTASGTGFLSKSSDQDPEVQVAVPQV